MKEGITREQSAVLRGIAILMMIYHHVFATPETYKLEYFSVLQFGGVNVERQLAWFCKMTVGIFIFVSGYGMYYVLQKRPVKEPAKESFAGYLLGCYRQSLAKLARLYAQYWYALIVSMTLVFLFDPEAPVFSPKEFLLNMLGLSCSYNGTWWYILQYVKMLLLLPLVAFFFHRFTASAQEKRKWFFCGGVAAVALLCLLAGRLWFPKLWDFIVWAAHGLRISFTLVFIVGYMAARFGLYQRIIGMKLFEKDGSGKEVSETKLLIAGVFALVVSVVVRVLLADNPAYANTDFLIVPVFVFGVLTVLERLPGLQKVLRMFGGLSAYMWLVHIFFFRDAFRPLVILTGISTGIFLTLTALSAGSAALLKAGENLVLRRRGKKVGGKA